MTMIIRTSRSRTAGFTLIELLVSMAIITLLLLMLVQTSDSVTKTWTYTSSRVNQFREARDTFESITRRISQATLNTYWDYVDAAGLPPSDPKYLANPNSFVPVRYARSSELRFISGPATQIIGSTPARPSHAVFFQAPIGYTDNTSSYGELQNMLNTWGFFIEWGKDTDSRPDFITDQMARPKWRFRLMELMEPAESLSVYKFPTGKAWFQAPLVSTNPVRKRVLAENILFITILPEVSTAEGGAYSLTGASYTYDSTTAGANGTNPAYNTKNQLPPLIRVTMMALDEATFSRYQAMRGSGETTAPTWVDNKFQNGSDAGHNADVAAITTLLDSNHLKYRNFTTVVPIRGAKWSTN